MNGPLALISLCVWILPLHEIFVQFCIASEFHIKVCIRGGGRSKNLGDRTVINCVYLLLFLFLQKLGGNCSPCTPASATSAYSEFFYVERLHALTFNLIIACCSTSKSTAKRILQGVSEWTDKSKSALRGWGINSFIELWFLVASGGADICVSSNSFEKKMTSAGLNSLRKKRCWN